LPALTEPSGLIAFCQRLANKCSVEECHSNGNEVALLRRFYNIHTRESEAPELRLIFAAMMWKIRF